VTRAARSYALSGVLLLGASPARADSPSKVDCVVANETGQTLVQSGKRLEAERTFATCMAASCPRPVREDCAQRLAEIGRTVPSIAFELKDSTGHAVSGARITMDGEPLPGDAVNGKPVRLDSGEHRFLFEAQGLSPIEKVLVLREGERNRKEAIVFAAASDHVPTAVGIGVAERPPMKPPPSPSPMAAVPTLAYVAAGVGVAGLAFGIGTGIAASSKNAALESECPGGRCPPGAQHDIDAFRTLTALSTAGYVVAAAGLAGGVILWVAAPKAPSSDTAATFWLGPQTAGVAGRF
jgi:hypothetical protein